jgi:hypothetical protein
MSSHGSASALPETVRPVDWLLAAYNGTLAVLWAGLWDRAWYALPVATAHAAAACLPALLARLRRNTPRPLGLLREAYPLLWIPALWLELDPLIAGLHEATIDPSILALDLAVFGVHLDRVWMPAMPQMWFSEIMHFAYYAYLPLICGSSRRTSSATCSTSPFRRSGRTSSASRSRGACRTGSSTSSGRALIRAETCVARRSRALMSQAPSP